MSDTNVLEALLSLDLREAGSAARAAFVRSLEENDWEAVPEVAHAFCASLEDMTRDEALGEIEADLAEAAAAASIESYGAAIQMSPELAVLISEGDD